MPTIKDIARAAGVSHGTVSNVLNKTGKVSIEKIKLVEETARKLGYVPNAQAQMLRSGTPTIVALLLPTLKDNAYLDLYMALSHELQLLGYETALYLTGGISGKEEKLISDLPLSRIAAALTVTCLDDNALRCYDDLPFPVVFINHRIPEGFKDAYSFSFDFNSCGIDLGNYVLKQGWKSVAFFSSNRNIDCDTLFSGLKNTLSDSVKVDTYISDTNLILNKAFDIIHSGEVYDAIITTNSARADALATALTFRRPERAPQLLAITSFKSFSSPHYLTYELDYSQMGAKISSFLRDLFGAADALPKESVLPCKGFPFQFPFLEKGEPETITMLALDSPTTNALQMLLPQFEELTGISVKITNMPYDDVYEQIQLMSPDFYYDLIRMDVAWLDTLEASTYQPLNDLDLRFDKRSSDLFSSPSSDYSLPFDPSVQIFLYRTDLFSDATLCRAFYEKYHKTLCVPQTLEQLSSVAEFFSQAYNPDSPTEFGTTATCGMAFTAACDFLPYYLASGGEISFNKSGDLIIDKQLMIECLKMYVKIYSCSNKKQNKWWDDSVRSFANGSAATATAFSNHASYLFNSKYSDIIGKTGVAVVPGGHPLLGGGTIGISKCSKKTEACYRFFNWYYTNDIASAIVRLGGTSPITNVYNDFENFTTFPWLSTSRKSLQLSSRGFKRPSPSSLSIRRFEYVLGTTVRNVLSGSMTPEGAVQYAETVFHSIETN